MKHRDLSVAQVTARFDTLRRRLPEAERFHLEFCYLGASPGWRLTCVLRPEWTVPQADDSVRCPWTRWRWPDGWSLAGGPNLGDLFDEAMRNAQRLRLEFLVPADCADPAGTRR